jgi:hypothetical protein
MFRRTLTAALGTAALLVAAATTGPAAADVAPVAPDLFVLQPAYGYPNTVTGVTGVLCGAAQCAPAGETITMQVAELGTDPATGTWEIAGTATTRTGGAFTALITLTHDMLVRAVYAGGAQFTAATTAPVPANEHRQNMLAVMLFSPAQTWNQPVPVYPFGQDVSMSGAFGIPDGVTVPADAVVQLQIEPATTSYPPGHWQTVGTAHLYQSGWFSDTFRFPHPGDYLVRGYFPGDENLWPAAAEPIGRHQAASSVTGSPTLTATRSPAGTVVVNQTVTVTGVLSSGPATGWWPRAIELDFTAAGSSISRKLAATTADPVTGAYQVHGPVPGSGTLTARFLGTPSETPARTALAVSAVRGSPRLRMTRVPAATVTRGAAIRFTGTLSRTPASPTTTRPMRLYFQPRGTTSWVLVSTTTARVSDGWFTVTARAARTGTWRIAFPGSRTENATSYSRTVTAA